MWLQLPQPAAPLWLHTRRLMQNNRQRTLLHQPTMSALVLLLLLLLLLPLLPLPLPLLLRRLAHWLPISTAKRGVHTLDRGALLCLPVCPLPAPLPPLLA